MSDPKSDPRKPRGQSRAWAIALVAALFLWVLLRPDPRPDVSTVESGPAVVENPTNEGGEVVVIEEDPAEPAPEAGN